MRAKGLKLLMMVVLLAGYGLAVADVLLIEELRERMLRDLPSNGMTQAEVEQRFGRPAERRAAVGNPPITRWIYADYSVYFEYDIVIESVLHHGAVLSRTDTTDY